LIRAPRIASRALSLCCAIALAACGAEQQAATQAPPSPAQAAGQKAPAAEDASIARLPLEERATFYRDRQMYPQLLQTLERVSTAEEVSRSLDWSKRSLFVEAKTVAVAYPYSRNLMRIAGAAPPESKVSELKDTAAMAIVYALAVISVDGHKCADTSAPGHWMTKTIADWAPLWRDLAAMPAQRRDSVVDLALRLETMTFAKRQPDPFICSGGARTFANADFSKAVEVPTPPGEIGRTFVLPNDPAYVPEYRAEAEYGPKVGQARGQLRQVIGNLLQTAATGARKS
jgi:hypothetical protein